MLKLLHEVGRSVAVLHDNALLFVYRYGAGWPKPHFHPLYAPGSSRPLTLHAPHDNVHHRGLMWSWGRVTPQSRPDEWVNFWDERLRERAEDGHITWGSRLPEERRGVIRHTSFDLMEPGRERAHLVANHEWRRVSDDALLLTQCQTVTAYPTSDNAWFFDLQFEMRAVGEPMLLGSMPVAGEDGADIAVPYDSTPYGLACQLSRELAGGCLMNSEGQSGVKCIQSPAAWCDYSGPVDDDEDGDGWVGLAIMSHPSNPRHPSPFFATTHSLGFLSAAPTAFEPLLVSTQASRTFRYRVLSHRGRGTQANINARYEEFAQS